MDTLIFYIFFGVCFICFAIRTSYYVLANRESRLAENKRFITMLFVVMFFLWFSWFWMSFNDPVVSQVKLPLIIKLMFHPFSQVN